MDTQDECKDKTSKKGKQRFSYPAQVDKHGKLISQNIPERMSFCIRVLTSRHDNQLSFCGNFFQNIFVGFKYVMNCFSLYICI